MNKKFLISGLITTVINLLLHTANYIFILKDFYRSYSALSEECRKQFYRQPDQLIIWAMAVTSLAMGFLITIVIKWSGEKQLKKGLRMDLFSHSFSGLRLTLVYMLHPIFFHRQVFLLILLVVLLQ